MRDYEYTLSRLKHQYVCKECNYHRKGLLDQPAIGIGSYSTVCPECGGQYESYEVCNHPNIIKEEHITGEGSMEYVEWYDNYCPDCNKKWTTNE